MSGWLREFISRLSSGTRKLCGFSVPEKELRPNARPARKSKGALESLRKAAYKDPEAARFLLRQRILIGDTTGTAEFYEEIVLPRYPDLVLDPPNQAALVRMLEFGGYATAGGRAAALFLSRYPAETGWEGIAIANGRMLLGKGDASLLLDAIRHLGRVEQASTEKRVRSEAGLLREALTVRAEASGLVLDSGPVPREAVPPEGEPGGSTLQLRVVSGPRKREVRRGETGEGVAPDPSRSEASQVLEGRKPLSMKSAPAMTEALKSGSGKGTGSLDRLAGGVLPNQRRQSNRAGGLMPFLSQQTKGEPLNDASVYDGAPDDGSSPDEEPRPQKGPTPGEGAYGPTAPLPSLSGAPDRQSIMPDRQPGADAGKVSLPAQPDGRAETHGLPYATGAADYAPSSLATPASGRTFGGTSDRRDPGKFSEGSPDSATTKYAVLLKDTSGVHRDVIDALATAHTDGGRTGRPVHGVPGLVVRETEMESALALQDALRAQGLSVYIVADSLMQTVEEAMEAVSVQIDGDQLVFGASASRIPVCTAEVKLLNYSRVKFSTRSQSVQSVIEVIANTTEGQPFIRIALWERTCSPSTCRIDGEPVSPENPLPTIYDILSSRVPPESVAPGSAREVSTFHSFRDYDDSMAFEILSRWGTQ